MSRLRYTYFDTSAVRRVGGALVSLKDASSYYYTSVVTLVELMNGICLSKEEYKRRQGCLLGIHESDLVVDWIMPEEKIFSAFPVLKQTMEFREERRESLQKLVECAVTYNNLQDFITNSTVLNLKYPLSFFENYDVHLTKVIKKEDYLTLCEAFKSYGMEYEHLPPELGMPQAASIREFCKLFEFHCVYRRLAILALTTWVVRMSGLAETDEIMQSAFESYNGSLDTYIKAYCYFHMKRFVNGGQAGRNDFLDLLHFMYLSQDTRLICDDKKMIENAQAIGCMVERSDQFQRGTA